MSNIVAFSKAGLPAVQDLASTLRKLETSHDVGSVIIKMDKTGHWVFGADQTEAEGDARWAVNPFSFTHGFIAWGDGEVLGEKMVSISEPLPDLGVAPPAAKKGWEAQVGMSLKCMSGEDAGMDARYSVTSVGGKRAVQTLAVAIAAQVEKDPSKPVPVVHLKKEHYQHKSYGRIFTPVFEIVDWISMDGEAKQEESTAETAPDAGAAGRRRRS
jgi:hypothetical protein